MEDATGKLGCNSFTMIKLCNACLADDSADLRPLNTTRVAAASTATLPELGPAGWLGPDPPGP